MSQNEQDNEEHGTDNGSEATTETAAASNSGDAAPAVRSEGGEDGALYGVVAEFDGPAALKKGAAAIRDAGYSKWDCYSPFPVHGIDSAIGIRRTILPAVVFCGGLTGTALGLGLQWWTNAYNWPWLISGKPFWSIPASIPIGFETTVLLAAFTAFFGMWMMNRLPQHFHPFFRSNSFVKASNDGFIIGIEAEDSQFKRGETVELLKKAGATAVETVHLDPDPAKKKMPAPLVAFIAITAVMALVPFALVAKARATKSGQPHYHIIPDMDFQFKNLPQAPSDIFGNGRASRPGVAGTVAVGQLHSDYHFHRGIVPGPAADAAAPSYQWATTFPEQLEISESTMASGQATFDIFCTPCHGISGRGNGMIAQRAKRVPAAGWNPPSDLHLEMIILQPHGQLFNTISHGIRTMPGYAAQIDTSDRWAIILYLRALQRSQKANLTDVPADRRGAIR